MSVLYYLMGSKPAGVVDDPGEHPVIIEEVDISTYGQSSITEVDVGITCRFAEVASTKSLDTVTVSIEDYMILFRRACELDALIMSGVDNWEWFGDVDFSGVGEACRTERDRITSEVSSDAPTQPPGV